MGLPVACGGAADTIPGPRALAQGQVSGMQVEIQTKEWRVAVRLDNDAEEACYVYDLVQSGRILIDNKEYLPLPFRGQFLMKLPERPRPVSVQVARFEPGAGEAIAEGKGPTLLVSCARGSEELLRELEEALRDIPPVSAEEFKSHAAARTDEFSRIRNMTFAQKVIFATRAGAGGRVILMQQPSPLLLLYLCKNPLITLPEVIQIAKLPSIDALVAEYIVKLLRLNPQWALSEELKTSLVSNPKTPIGTALALLSYLSAHSLRALCKGGAVRNAIKQAAVRILQERHE
jgi:hypothetical protein